MSYSIVVFTTPNDNWQTFATWYSFNKFLPKITIVCFRDKTTPFEYFQWAKRLNVPVIHKNKFSETSEYVNWLQEIGDLRHKKMIGEHIFVIKPLVMMLDSLDEGLLKKDWRDESMWWMSNVNTNDLLDRYFLKGEEVGIEKGLCSEVKDAEEFLCFGSYTRGCGRWIDTSKGCPFSNAAGLASIGMTVNEHRVIELWKKMTSLYQTVN